MFQLNALTADFSPSPQLLRKKNLFKRCLDCANVTTTGCPTTCTNQQVCVLTALECDKCPEYQCQSASAAGQVKLGSNPEPSTAPQIAGGVVGGVLVIAILLFLIWKFAIRKKKRHESKMWESMDYPMEKPGELSAIPRDARSRASTHTTTSMASTVLTRASNIIQIAYIPGVTNRQGGGGSNDGQEPPVPPVPIPTNEEQLLFLPGDLRSSAYTDISEFNGGTRKSVTPSLARTSIASALVRDNAVAVMTAKPALVSVSKGSATNSLAGTPPVPSIDMKRFGSGESSSGSSTPSKGVVVRIPASSDNIRIPASMENVKVPGLTTIPTGVQMKPRTLTITRKGKGSIRSPSGTSSQYSNATTENIQSPNLGAESPAVSSSKHFATVEDHSDEEDDISGNDTRQALLRKHNVSPFTDAAAVESSSDDGKGKSRKSPATPTTPGSPSSRSEGPFSDNHAVKE